MDLKNLCQKIDVDSLRAKIPPMPALPALPQFKLPKSMPKLKSRKIFKTSRDNVSKSSSTPKHQQQQQQQQQLALPQSPADFIDRTPTRISTISSLLHSHPTQQPPPYPQQRNLMLHTHESSTYRSACSINDDDYPSPTAHFEHCDRISSRPISPVRMPSMVMLNVPNISSNDSNNASGDTSATNPNARKSLTEMLQQGYRDITDFKFKHIFAKRTVVRKDNIEVDHYVQRYDEDRMREEREQAHRDSEIKDNYRFKFKVSRQNTGHTNSISSNESRGSSEHNKERSVTTSRQPAGKSVSEQSGDESGMEATPTQHKIRGRFTVQLSGDEHNALTQQQQEFDELPTPEPISSTLWSIRESRSPKTSTPKRAVRNDEKSIRTKERKGNKRRFISYISSRDESAPNESVVEVASGGVNMLSKLRNFGKRNDVSGDSNAVTNNESSGERKRKAPLTPQQSEEQANPAVQPVSEKPLMAIKQNFKRFQKSMSRPTTSASDTDDDDDTPNKSKTKKPTKTEKLAARLRSFRGHGSADELSKSSPKKDDTNTKSPRTAFSKKIQTWKQSLKKKESPTKIETESHTGDESTPEKQQQKRPSKLIKKLKHIRTARKQPTSTEDHDVVDEDAKDESAVKNSSTVRKPSNLKEKFTLARDRTIKKVDEKMHQMKFFHRSQDHGVKANDNNTPTKTTDDECDEVEKQTERHNFANAPPNICRRSATQQQNVSPYDSEQDEIEEMAKAQREYSNQRTRAAWTTKSILSDSVESDTDVEFPRVLIHQDNSDLFESTLIISVTRPASTSPSPIITEILPEHENNSKANTKPVEWISNKEIISNFMNASSSVSTGNEAHAHLRRPSMDSNPDADAWNSEKLSNKQQGNQSKENSRRGSAVGLNGTDEKEAPWKVQTTYREEKLYKTRSIDIFDANAKSGGANTAFEDFDDALKNAPVVRINAKNSGSIERDNSSDDADAPDDDNSSRITKILVKTIPEECEEPPTKTHLETKPQLRQIGNSQESLIAHFNDEDDENDTDDEDEDDRPPSAAPSPPPAMPSISPPPPPLPQRQPSIRMSKIVEKESIAAAAAAPPLPVTKPPVQQEPPKIPERTPSMQRMAKPLVKTSSLRLAYNEQVKPADVGKVNKLISRFEKPQPRTITRPRIIARKIEQDDSEDYTDEDDEIDDGEHDNNNSDDSAHADDDDDNNNEFEHETTPTPTNTKRTVIITANDKEEIFKMTKTATQTETIKIQKLADGLKPPTIITPSHDTDDNRNTKTSQRKRQIPTIEIERKSLLDIDANVSLSSAASSEYGSPLKYTSNLMLSTETTPIQERKLQEPHSSSGGRNRRSVATDDDNYYSFDSDEENSYYSISPSGSNRYIVEI